MPTTIYSDQSQPVKWVVRESTDVSLTLTVTLSSAAYNLSTYTFVAEFFKVGSSTAFLTLTQGSGITNGGAAGTIILAITDTQLTVDPNQYFWRLKTTAPTDNVWFNGVFDVQGYISDVPSSSSATVALTIGGDTLSVALTIAGADSLATLGTTLQTAANDTPLDADTFNFWDAVDAILKKVSWTNIKATLKTYFDALYVPNYELITATGTDTYAATVTPTPTLTNGFKFQVKFTNANTGASTLNVNSLGAVTLRKHDGTALSSGDVAASSDWWAVYDGTASQWRLLGGGSSSGGGDVTGAASSVDNEVPLFSGTGGKTLKNSSKTLTNVTGGWKLSDATNEVTIKGALQLQGDNGSYEHTFPAQSGTVALLTDIPSVTSSRIKIVNSNTDVPNTGSTTENKVYSLLINANTVQSADKLFFQILFTKSGSAGLATVRIYFNTSDSLSGATIIGGFVLAATSNTYAHFVRTLFLKSLTTQKVLNAANTSLSTDYGVSNTTTTTSVDFGSNQYYILSIQNASAADTTTIEGNLLEIIR